MVSLLFVGVVYLFHIQAISFFFRPVCGFEDRQKKRERKLLFVFEDASFSVTCGGSTGGVAVMILLACGALVCFIYFVLGGSLAINVCVRKAFRQVRYAAIATKVCQD